MSRLRPTNQTKNSHKITNKFQNSKFKKKKLCKLLTLYHRQPFQCVRWFFIFHLSLVSTKIVDLFEQKFFQKLSVCFVASSLSTLQLIWIFSTIFFPPNFNFSNFVYKKISNFFPIFPIFFHFFFKKKQIFDFVVFCLNLLSTEPFTAPLIVQRASTSRPCDWSTPTRTFPKKVEFFLIFFKKKCFEIIFQEKK